MRRKSKDYKKKNDNSSKTLNVKENNEVITDGNVWIGKKNKEKWEHLKNKYNVSSDSDFALHLLNLFESCSHKW